MFEVDTSCPYLCSDCYELGCGFCNIHEQIELALNDKIFQKMYVPAGVHRKKKKKKKSRMFIPLSSKIASTKPQDREDEYEARFGQVDYSNE